jgi:hypothetical protein
LYFYAVQGWIKSFYICIWYMFGHLHIYIYLHLKVTIGIAAVQFSLSWNTYMGISTYMLMVMINTTILLFYLRLNTSIYILIQIHIEYTHIFCRSNSSLTVYSKPTTNSIFLMPHYTYTHIIIYTRIVLIPINRYNLH